MNLIIRQTPTKVNYEYKLYENKNILYTAKINSTKYLIPKKVDIYDSHDDKISYIVQEDKKKFYLSCIPFLGLNILGKCQYNYYKYGELVGFAVENFKGGSHIFSKIGADEYEVWNPKNDNICIYDNGKQVALLNRNRLGDFYGDYYTVKCNRSFSKELLILFCLIADVEWFAWAYGKHDYSFSIQFGGRRFDENWTPED